MSAQGNLPPFFLCNETEPNTELTKRHRSAWTVRIVYLMLSTGVAAGVRFK